MGDFIRYIFTAPHDLTIDKLNTAFKAINPAFMILPDTADPTSGDLMYNSLFYGEIALNEPNDDNVKEDLDELREILPEDDPDAAAIRTRLETIHGMFLLKLSENGHADYDRIDPIWDWLFNHHEGMLQIDEEGFYDQSGLIA